MRSKLPHKYRNVNNPQYTLRICVPNHLELQFAADTSGRVWVSDITYIHTIHGFRYLTTVLDLFDHKVVGWSLSGNDGQIHRSEGLSDDHRSPQPGMIFYSDQGVGSY